MHYPVLLKESIDLLGIKSDGIYIDGTFGRGGHSKEILKSLGHKGKLIAFDKDIDAVEYAKYTIHDERFSIVHDSFANLNQYLIHNKIIGIDGLLLDLGVSSPQLDSATRGFSFRLDAKLDMRMDTTKGISLKDWINQASEKNISEVLWNYGEECFHKKIAKNIIFSRNIEPIKTTLELAKIIKDSIPFNKKTQHPATKSFQAFRIMINNEINDLQIVLDSIPNYLNVNGRVVAISFHSLEDRLIKNKFNELSGPKKFPKWVVENSPEVAYKIIAKKIRPNITEVKENRRSRSAIVRGLERIL